MHSRCSTPFSLSLILPGRRRTLKSLERIALRALPAGVCYALRCESTTAGHLVLMSLACLAKMSCTSSRLNAPLVSAVSRLRQVVLSQHGHRFAITLGCPVARPQTRQKLLLAPQPRIASLRPIRLQLLDGLQALASAQLIIILLIRFSATTCATITERFGA